MIRPSLLLILVLCTTSLVAGCENPDSENGATDRASDSAAIYGQQRAVEEIVARFASRMQTVSLQAAHNVVSAQVREAYGELVTFELLAEWMELPDSAPGRRVSSPWPDRIEVDTIRRLATDLFEVTGQVVYVTSVDRTPEASAATEPVRLRVIRMADESWRISEYAEGPGSGGD